MSIEDNLALLESLDQKGTSLRRPAGWVAWGSVITAGIVMAVLIFLAQRKLEQVRRQVEGEEERLTKVQKERAKAQTERDTARQLAQNYQSILSNVTKTTALAAATDATAKSGAGTLFPRVYLQIVNEDDRDYAKQVGKMLQDHGLLVLAVEYVSKAAGLKQTQVRYYKKAEEPEAERIRDLLKQSGETGAITVYLKQDNNTKVRPNRFEVWFASHAAR